MTREGGWSNHRAYPLILSVQAELAVQKFRIERGNLSMGKALNQLVNAGLIAYGYLVDPAKCQHEYHWVKPEGELYSIAKCLKCGSKPDPEELKATRVLE